MPPSDEQNPTRLSVIATVSGILRAEVLKSKLESAGIPTVLSYESAGLVFGITTAGLALSQVQVLVSRQDVAAAHELLAVENPDAPDDDGCDEALT